MSGKRRLTYGGYLRLDELLALQQPLSRPAEHDETLFIVVHQVYELWFKQILHELGLLRVRLAEADTMGALATLKRVLTILKTLVAQIDVLETMTPVAFSAFRTRLESSSGFQSLQFRELEIALGRRDPQVADVHRHDVAASRRLRAAMRQPSMYDAFLGYLSRLGCEIPDELLQRDVSRPAQPSPVVQDILLEIYRVGALATQVCERLVDLDEGMQEWRYRHVKMVERTIGGKPGTGGSAGVEYLRGTLFRPLFPDLWAIRLRL